MAINFPSSPTNGQVYTDTTSAMTWVYSSTDTAWSGSFNRSNYVSQTFTATAGQTSFTVTGGYLPTLIEVYQNGVLLVNGTDVTVTSGTVVVLATGAIVGDIIQVIGNQTFNAAAIDASAITSGTLPVARGGTGSGSLTANNVLLGNGTSAVQAVAPGTTGNVLTSNGTTWQSTAPTLAVINTQTFNSSSTWTKPAGYSANSRVHIECWGGGGSGSRVNATNSSNGNGGGGAGYNSRWLTLSQMGATETITVGAGGAATTVAGNGNTGGNSSVGSLITAYGGGGANASTNSTGGGGGQLSAGAAGGVRGNPSFGAGGCDVQGASPGVPAWITGGSGGTNAVAGASSVWGGGGGGGGFGTTATNIGGTSSFAGNGGAGSSASGVAGVAGTAPGGGGGAGNNANSGAGAAGRVIITVFPA